MKKTLFLLFLSLISSSVQADKKISELPLLSASSCLVDDAFPVVNTALGETDRVKLWDLANIPTIVSTYAPKTTPTFLDYIGISGSTSGTISIKPQAVAGTYNFNLPTTAGTAGYYLTSGGGGSSPMTWSSPSPGGGTPGGSNTQVQYNSSGSFGGDAALTYGSGALSVGSAGSTLGTVAVSGNTSGTVTIKPQAAAGTYNFNLPTTAGTAGYVLTSGGGGSSPMTWSSPSPSGGGSSPSSTCNFSATFSASTHTSTGNWQDITSYDTPVSNVGAAFNSTSGVFTACATGGYQFNASIAFTANGAGNARAGRLVVNGTTYYAGGELVPDGVVNSSVLISFFLPLTAGDTVKLQGFQDSGGNLTYYTNYNQFSGVRMY